MKRLPVLLLMLALAALACNAPVSEGGGGGGAPSGELAAAWEQALNLSQGQFNLTLTEAMLEEAIFNGVSQQSADIQRDDIDLTINADGTMQLVFTFTVPNLGADADATVNYTLAVTETGDLNVDVQSATVSGLGGVTINVPPDILEAYNGSINNALTGANFTAANTEVTITDLAFEQGSVTVTGQIARGQ